ncbi:MAG: dihydroorotate dehydrogenase [Gemmatimonadales bacterium]
MTLARKVAGIHFANPILLAAGTAGYGREIAGVVALRRLGGLVTKAVSRAPRAGNRAPRVAEIHGAMLNSVGLANPGVAHVRDADLPWLAANAPSLPVLVNVVGFTAADFAEVIRELDDCDGHVGYELNLSCPNTTEGGLEFGADANAVHDVIGRCRRVTQRPMFAKLSPALPSIPAIARVARESGADGVTLINTLPGAAYRDGRPRLGNESGGLSGPALLPAGLLAVRRTAEAIPGIPIIGVGGISHVDHVRDYFHAGATLVAIGTAALADPRLPERIITALEQADG